jgi:hypothetical protein
LIYYSLTLLRAINSKVKGYGSQATEKADFKWKAESNMRAKDGGEDRMREKARDMRGSITTVRQEPRALRQILRMTFAIIKIPAIVSLGMRAVPADDDE